ncbi:MAG: acetoacetate--CoA ligase [Alphaproteobacteria bacterium]|nr:acetoacetate--CoA ligase [Alphaproteobacteria bacterium]
MDPQINWRPKPEAFRKSNMARFARICGFDAADYDSLHRWSVARPGDFWSEVWDFADLAGDKGETKLETDPQHPMTGAVFFPDGTINLAENLLRGALDDVVVMEADETGAITQVTRGALIDRVGRCADGLLQSGIGKGDCVACVLPNRTEALVTLLAAASIGAVWSSCSPDFGPRAIIDRLGQIAPKVLFVTARYGYGGRHHDISERIVEIANAMPSLRLVVSCGKDCDAGLGTIAPSVHLREFGADRPIEFEPVAFSDPLYVLYTSGTTGAPKAIVHSTGGVVLQHVKEHMLHGDVGPGDVVLWYTNTAWMMYHWMISAMSCGAAIVLYDGAPILNTDDGLDCSPLWSTAERCAVSHLGISPKFLATLEDQNYAPGKKHDLSALRALMACGAPTYGHQFDWVYDHVKQDMMFASISGGTEIIGCFLLGSPIHPVRRGELTVKGLGMAVNVVDERGAPVVGRRGDLVCTEPFPSMPLTFWGADGKKRYHDTYFSDRREIWTHGDIAELTVHGSAVVHGRADATLKPGGVRIGSSEIYSSCEGFSEIEDCLVFGTPVNGDEEVVLCLQLAQGQPLDNELAKRVRMKIRQQASPRHVPHRIYAVSAIPYTLNAKRVEAAGRAALTGDDVGRFSSISNPDCLAEYAALPQRTAL